MSIKNVSNRIINIGTTILRPDDTMPATDQLLETPAIKALIAKGWLSTEKAAKTTGGAKNGKGSGKGKNDQKTGSTSETGDGKDAKDDSSAGSGQKDPGSSEGQ